MTVPLDCPKGSFCPTGATVAVACPSGRYSNVTGLTQSSSCLLCPAGSSCASGSIQSGRCPPGTASPALGSSECALCAAGSYNIHVGATACITCPKGDYCPVGSSQPLPCAAGSFSNTTGLQNSSRCRAASPGFYSLTGSFEEKPCPQGSYSSQSGTSSCAPCDRGKFQSTQGSTACAPCPSGSYCPAGSPNPLGCESGADIAHAETKGAQASSSSDCVCREGYFDDQSNPHKVNCQTCPAGTHCKESGFSLRTLPILPGYYRLHQNSIDVRKCVDAARNCSRNFVCATSTSGCSGTIHSVNESQHNETQGCHNSLRGVYCLLCEQSHTRKAMYYVPSNDNEHAHCRECSASALSWIVSGVISAVIIMSAALTALKWHQGLNRNRRAQLQYVWRKFTPHVKVKILAGFYLISSVIDEVYEVELPIEAQRLIEILNIGVSLGLDSGIGVFLECLGMKGYVMKLAMYMLLPMGISALIIFTGACYLRSQLTLNALLELVVPYLMQFFFLMYPLVTRVAFNAFSCYEFTESSWLKADVSIECSSAEHRTAQTLAWVAIVLYPIGLLVLNGILLLKARHAILSKKETSLSRAIAFLYRDYETHMFWWELVEMFRRFVLVGVMVLFQGTMLQLVVGIILCAAFLLFQLLAAPYNEWPDDLIASVASFSLLVLFASFNTFKYTELTNLEHTQSVMSNEQKSLYIVDIELLIVIIFIGMTGSLVFAVVIFSWQLYAESYFMRVKLVDGEELALLSQDMAAYASSQRRARTSSAGSQRCTRALSATRRKRLQVSIGRTKFVLLKPREQTSWDQSAKFTVNTFITGNPEDAAYGLTYFMGVPDPFGLSVSGMQRIQKEVARLVAHIREMEDDWPEASLFKSFARTTVMYAPSNASILKAVACDLEEWLDYVIHKTSSEKTFHNGVRDLNRGSVKLDYFTSHKVAAQALLDPAHVVALRFYTTHAFKYMNGPLRSQAYGPGKLPHPLPVTMMFLSDAIKKLRAVHALRPEATKVTHLWRGMRNLELADSFMNDLRGGTEVSPMSTTKSVIVASHYSASHCSLLFKIKVSNFVQYGAELEWVSVFPAEAEVCYPPLTYLQPTGLTQTLKVDKNELLVCEVIPHIP